MSLPAELVRQLDEVAGPRNRSTFAEEALRRAIKREKLRLAIERTAGFAQGGGLSPLAHL